ncbi:ABC-type multidrug transport system fused ATPase/permease subunit [Deinobacterium chartae]|uniref:ABC-type multidrug transport system fused ATPase/permease subunit n=1 Tax=Deinobacterium chartae TaxID=521158 RepID=A0A841I292_9DEIO|nr:ABC transporter ATP-binding protein [Deinobacterium chartae]MBB6099393.1 ABC-type multidrug transport system fused ATPase/permease subunit [Deinobacterium chartae]
MLRYLGPQRGRAVLLAVLLLASIGLQLFVPQILRYFIDAAQQGAALRSLLAAAGLFLVAALVTQLLSAAATYVGTDVGWAATNRMRADLVRHVLRLDMRFHKDRTPGELIERIDGDVTALSNFFSQFAVRVFGAALLLLGILVLLWLENAWVGAALTAFTLLVMVVMNRAREFAVPATRLEREASAQMFGFIEERLAGLDDLRASGAGNYAMYRFRTVLRDFFVKSRRAWVGRSQLWLLTMGLFAVGYVLTLGMAVWLFGTGAISLGTAYLFFQYMTMLEAPIDQITQQMQELQKAGASVIRVDELLREHSVLEEGPRELPGGPLGLDLEGVSFAYGDRPVLRAVNLRLAPGESLGLLGRTGSGKTTLTRLLLRLYDPQSGSVRLGGEDLRAVRLASLRSRVGVVTQDVQLFSASVRDNLTFFDASIPDARLCAVLEEVGLGYWLRSLPDGLDTPLSAGGGSLSAGQAQLLAFARVLLRDPGLVILDEPSSRLDPASEALLQRAIDRLLAGRTAIVIAHRLETVARVDRVAVMGDGTILEEGPRAALALDPHSRFARMLRSGRDLDEAQELELMEEKA